MDKDEALKLALEALNTTESDCGSRAWEREQEAITAIKQARSAPVQSAERGEPEYWNVIDPAGNIVASETDAIRGWARIAGSYKPTVEGLLGFHDQGWRVVPKVAPPTAQPAPVQEPVAWVDWLPEGTTHIAKCKATTSSGGSLSLRTHAFKYEADVLKVYTTDNDNEYPGWRAAKDVFYHLNFAIVPLYTTPPAQPAPVPLTDDQIRGLTPKPDGVAEGNVRRVEVLPGVMGTEFDEVDAWSMPLVLQIARSIEAAHGITKGQP